MKLLHATLRPARVIEVLGHGDIKVEAPGIFSAEDQENLPTVMPFFGLHANSYSEPKIQDEVWLLNLEDNPLQLFWFRKDDRTEHNQAIEEEVNVEVLCNRESGAGYATIYFSDGTGWMIRKDSSCVNIRADGSIVLNANIPHRVIDICNGSISLGTEGGSEEPAVLGNSLKEVLEQIQVCLETIRQASSTSIYTQPIAIALGSMPTQIKNQIPKIISQNVTLD